MKADVIGCGCTRYLAFRWISGWFHFYVEWRVFNWSAAIIHIDSITANIVGFVGYFVSAILVIDNFRRHQKTLGILQPNNTVRGRSTSICSLYFDQNVGIFDTGLTCVDTKRGFKRCWNTVANTRSVDKDFVRFEVRLNLDLKWTREENRMHRCRYTSLVGSRTYL